MPEPSSTEKQQFLTTESRTLVPGIQQPYRRLALGPGEPHAVRTDLFGAGSGAPGAAGTKAGATPGRHLAGLVHFTDFQIADLASPSRVEYLQRLDGVPSWERMLPAYRPQEFLLAQAIEATVRSVNRFVAADPQRWQLALTTGDNTDSAQSNELSAFLGYLAGGTIEPAAGTRDFADAPVGLGDPAYYNPEPGSQDEWTTGKGLPTHPGAVAAAARPFEGEGLSLPWLSCFGNHDCLVQGRAAAPTGYDDFLVADSKPVGFDPQDGPAGDKLSAYVADPRWVSDGARHAIDAEAERRMVSKNEYMARHLAAPGLPQGHGFEQDNVESGCAYYVHDALPGVRLIVLDTTNIAGHVDGCIDEAQWTWLQERLIEVHGSYRDASGTVRTGGGDHRVVVLASHHGLSTMTNAYGEHDGAGPGERGRLHLADDVRELLHRFPNVALWLSGHTHVNRVTPRPCAAWEDGGFWEVSTGSIAEWPVQFRGVELLVQEEALRIRTTMVDSQVPLTPDGSLSLEDLASLHREIGANDDGSVGGLEAQGTAADRNQDLLVPVSAGVLAALSTVHA